LQGPGGSGIGDCHLTVHEPQQGIVAFANGAGQAVGVGVDGLPLLANYRQSEALFSIRFLVGNLSLALRRPTPNVWAP
jgi:hypothetical protein